MGQAPALRARTTAATNKVESYNQFVAWCRFGNRGIIADNDPDEQERIVKFSTLLANCVIFHSAVDMTTVIRDLAAEGWTITAEDLATLSPYRPHPTFRHLRHRRGHPRPRRLRRPPGRRPGPTTPGRLSPGVSASRGRHAHAGLGTADSPASAVRR